MQIRVKYRSQRGGMKLLRCVCCRQPLLFMSEIEARDYCSANEITRPYFDEVPGKDNKRFAKDE